MGFLGDWFGRKPVQQEPRKQNESGANAQEAASASTSHGRDAGEEKLELIKLAVLAYQEPDGSLTLKGEDAEGNYFKLDDVSQPALLFVPRDTLPHLQGKQELWSRVKTPEVGTKQPSASEIPKPTGLLADLLLGPILDTIEAAKLSPGEFQVTEVDTYADATMKIKGLGVLT